MGENCPGFSEAILVFIYVFYVFIFKLDVPWLWFHGIALILGQINLFYWNKQPYRLQLCHIWTKQFKVYILLTSAITTMVCGIFTAWVLPDEQRMSDSLDEKMDFKAHVLSEV